MVRASSLYLECRRFESYPAYKKMKKTKLTEDKLLTHLDSPIMEEGGMPAWSEMATDGKGLAVTGKLSIGKNGNPVTICIEDEETGETLEINHVQSALLVVEDRRSHSSGWLSIAMGSIEKLSGVLEFLAKTTLEGLRKLTGK